MSKVILITGASTGLGAATAGRLVEQGYTVFGTSRRPDPNWDGPYPLLPLDVCSPKSIQACVRSVLQHSGRIDVLVNNAGYIGPAAAVEEISQEQLQAVFETNFFGVVQMTNAVLPVMRQQGRGQIIHVSSTAGRMASSPFFSAYTASKHALNGYAQTLRMELQPFNIHVSLVEPGYFRTAIEASIEQPAAPLPDYAELRQHMTEMDRICLQYGRHPQQVARVISAIVASAHPRLHYPVGLDAYTLILVHNFLPAWVGERLVRWLMLEGDTSSYQRADGSFEIERMGLLRRLTLDSEKADRMARTAAGVALAAGALLVGQRLFGRRR